jgi:HK97 family phage major capsid protein
MAPVDKGALERRLLEVKSRFSELHEESEGRFTPEQKDEWNRLGDEQRELRATIDELEAREAVLEEMADEPTAREGGAHFNVPSAGRVSDPFDLSTMRTNPFVDPEAAGREAKDRAKRALDMASFPRPAKEGGAQRLTNERAQEHVEGLFQSPQVDADQLARHILVTGSPAYSRAFGKAIANAPLSPEETRALSLAGSGGGFAVPYTLDPTVVPTSNLSVNPFRAISRVEQITGDEWRGVSSAGVTAAYAAEATEASDNAPSVAQPTISTEKAQAFVPFSIEVGMDWNGLQAEMAGLLQDAKDDLEATAFATGSGTNEPQGILTGATTVVTASGTASFAAADLYSLQNALGPRFRSSARGRFVTNLAQINRIRAFATAAGPVALTDNLQTNTTSGAGATDARLPVNVLGYPTYELSSMASVLTTGSLIGILGDFRYYVIVDRIGLTVELLPHLVGTNRRPTGQRGLYAYWRNSAGVISPNAFRVLKTG